VSSSFGSLPLGETHARAAVRAQEWGRERIEEGAISIA
jgi:hypothetical protein